MTKRRAFGILFCSVVLSMMFSTSAMAARVTRTPSASATTPPKVHAGNELIGLVILTAFAAAGYFVSKWVRRDRRPRAPGRGFGG
ncbi:MAG TPA: hypothetical protein VGW79_07300 [Actinomycetota bacterium]|nr:hypothetical protein [Actinomycetota bacterium]